MNSLLHRFILFAQKVCNIIEKFPSVLPVTAFIALLEIPVNISFINNLKFNYKFNYFIYSENNYYVYNRDKSGLSI